MRNRQLPAPVREFADYLRELLDVLDPQVGWYGVFAQRDPDGIRACLEGAEVLPWDVVESLLQDLASRHGAAIAEEQRGVARGLHRASVAAYDAYAGGRDALLDRLDVMHRERQYAVARERESAAAAEAAESGEAADRLAAELAWARDDHARATARCAELRRRLEALPDLLGTPGEAQAAKTRVKAVVPRARGARFAGVEEPDEAETAAAAPPLMPRLPAPTASRTKPRGARYAFVDDSAEDGAEAVETVPAPRAPEPEAPTAAAAPRAPGAGAPVKPRGARFAGAYDPGADARTLDRPRTAHHETPELVAARRGAAALARRLVGLRAAGRSGEAHAVLCEVVTGPAGLLPLLAAELEHSGLAADVATLLWEAACLPPESLAAAAAAFVDEDRAEDCRALFRQAVARTAPEIAETILAFHGAGRAAEAAALLEALLRARTRDEAVRVAEENPGTLVPMLLEAAAAISSHHYGDLAHILRVTGLPGVPDLA